MEVIASFFQLLHQDCKNDGTLKEKECEKLKRELRTKLKNAPKIEILDDFSEEVCLAIHNNYDESSNENMNQKPKVLQKQHFAPVTIMAVDTISSVNSRKLLKV